MNAPFPRPALLSIDEQIDDLIRAAKRGVTGSTAQGMEGKQP